MLKLWRNFSIMDKRQMSMWNGRMMSSRRSEAKTITKKKSMKKHIQMLKTKLIQFNFFFRHFFVTLQCIRTFFLLFAELLYFSSSPFISFCPFILIMAMVMLFKTGFFMCFCLFSAFLSGTKLPFDIERCCQCDIKCHSVYIEVFGSRASWRETSRDTRHQHIEN